MVVEENNHLKRRIRTDVLRVLKAAVKAIVVYVVYIVLERLLAPISMIVPDFQQILTTFVIVYIVLMVIGDLASGTILQHIFNAVKASFVIVYLVFTLNAGIFNYTVGNLNLMIDLRLFLVIAMFLGLLGLAKSVLQAMNFLNEKSESARV